VKCLLKACLLLAVRDLLSFCAYVPQLPVLNCAVLLGPCLVAKIFDKMQL
jgi:hypothetical protein